MSRSLKSQIKKLEAYTRSGLDPQRLQRAKELREILSQHEATMREFDRLSFDEQHEIVKEIIEDKAKYGKMWENE